MLLSDDHRAVQDAVRQFVQAEIAPHAAAWDKRHEFPAAALRGLAELGCYGVAVPGEYDGAGLDYLALALILEEVAAGDGATSTIVSVNNCPVCSILMAFGNEDQKQRYLKPLARGQMLGAFCLTEPHVGSEAGGLKTTALRDGDHYVLNGVKQFITSGKHGDAVAAELGQPLQLGSREVVALVPGRGLRRDAVLHEGAHGLLHGTVVVGQQHRVSRRKGKRVRSAAWHARAPAPRHAP